MPAPRDAFKDFCMKVVTSEAYRNKLQIRLLEGTIHPSMETLVLKLALSIADGDAPARDLTEMSNAELIRLSEDLLKVMRRIPEHTPAAGMES